jgi:hypothetical protein
MLALRGGLEPSAVSMMPALRSSSLNLPMACIASMASVVGRKPFSLSSVAFTNTITRIICLLFAAGIGTTNWVSGNRHRPANFFLWARSESRRACDLVDRI